jgi:hypothetical protein
MRYHDFGHTNPLTATGEFEQKKKDMLDYFWSTTNERSAIFRRYAHRIAEGLGHDLESEADYTELYKRLATLNSFVTKGPLAKMMRWFAWNEMCRFHKEEMAAFEMLIEHWEGPLDPCHADVNPNGETNARRLLQALKSVLGGFKLAQKLLAVPFLERRAAMFFVATQKTWSWYASQIRTIKAPMDGLTEMIKDTSSWATRFKDHFWKHIVLQFAKHVSLACRHHAVYNQE